MITRPTVLVLGAGASANYNFPLGRDLIISLCQDIEQKTQTYAQLLSCGFDESLILTFRNALNLSMQPSIDAFLENRLDYREVGKAAIACQLIPCENPSTFLRQHRTILWYEYLFSRIGRNTDEFAANKLSVVTFNYDRSLEHCLFLALQNSFALTDKDAASLLKKLPIVHVYGQLGEYPYLSESPGVRPYSPILTTETILQCASSIKIISEGSEDEPELQKAQELLNQAEVICFLGFGYHPENLRRLKEEITFKGKRIFGTAYRIKTAEIIGIRNKWRSLPATNVDFGDEEHDILTYLRDKAILG